MTIYQGRNLFSAFADGVGCRDGDDVPGEQGAERGRLRPGDRPGALHVQRRRRQGLYLRTGGRRQPRHARRHGEQLQHLHLRVFGRRKLEVYDPVDGPPLRLRRAPASRSTTSTRSTACSATGTTSSPISTWVSTESATPKASGSSHAERSSSRDRPGHQVALRGDEDGDLVRVIDCHDIGLAGGTGCSPVSRWRRPPIRPILRRG